MSPAAACLHDADAVATAVETLLQSGALLAAVLDSAGILVGFVTVRDLMVAAGSPDRGRLPLSAVMCRQVIAYDEGAPLRTIYEFLCRVSIPGVIITAQGRPTGVVDLRSLLAWLRRQRITA